jgi:hypothetical protein
MGTTNTRVGNADASYREKGNARLARQKRRNEAAIVREDRALTLFAQGLTVPEIARTIGMEFDMAAHEPTVHRIIRRGLERRAAEQPEEVAIARAMILDRYEAIFNAHMPLAIGAETGVPDVRSADVVLKVLDKQAEVLGVRKAPPTEGLINNGNIIVAPGNADLARAAILAALQAEAEKHVTIDGHLAAVGTGLRELTEGEEENDTLGPPPGVIIIPTQEAA